MGMGQNISKRCIVQQNSWQMEVRPRKYGSIWCCNVFHRFWSIMIPPHIACGYENLVIYTAILCYTTYNIVCLVVSKCFNCFNPIPIPAFLFPKETQTLLDHQATVKIFQWSSSPQFETNMLQDATALCAVPTIQLLRCWSIWKWHLQPITTSYF